MISPELLRRYPFFGTFSASQIKSMAMIAEETAYPKGAIICEEGESADAFCFLEEGSVSLYYKSEDELHPETRKEFLVGQIDPGEVFAISALVEPNIFTSTVKAEKECLVIKFNRDELNRIIQKDPKFYCLLMQEIAKAAMDRLSYARIQLAAAWAK